MDAKRLLHGKIGSLGPSTTWAQDLQSMRVCPMRQCVAAYRLLQEDYRGGLAEMPDEARRNFELFEELGLIETARDSEHTCSHSWSLQKAHVRQLDQPPMKIPHAGQFDWIGRASEGDPAYLWDAEEDRTVAATPEILSQGYCAVSYTWGRWRVRGTEVRESGTPWRLPTLDTQRCSLNRIHLKALLKHFRPSRYFWVDVFCINQDDPEQKRVEIAKQGSIFGKAQAALVYLWDIQDSSTILHCLEDIGSLILDSEFSHDIHPDVLPPLYGRSRCSSATSTGARPSLPRRGREEIMRRLRAGHWFSSLWTLQEMILSPCALWVTADLNFATLNGRPVTSRLFATAVQVLDNVAKSRFMGVEFLDTKWLHHGAGARGVDCPPREERHEAILALRVARDAERAHMQPWEAWIKTRASLYCCLVANRADILRAGALREASGRRGIAILAALKVEFHRSYEDDVLDPGRIPVALTNTLISHQGRSLFAVQHAAANPLLRAASGVLPSLSLASLPCDPNEYESLSTVGWHVHQDGSLYLPVETEIHDLGWRQMVMLVFNDGDETAAPALGAKHIVVAHLEGSPDLKHLSSYEVKFVPLARRRMRQRGLRAAFLAREGVIGMIIATVFRPGETSPTHWFKVGMYTTAKYKPTAIKSKWRGGLLVNDGKPTRGGRSPQGH